MKKLKIYSIHSLKASINYSLAIVFVAIFMAALTMLFLLHAKYLEGRNLLYRQELSQAIDAYQSNLSEKLSIIASSNTFIDYLRSGNLSRGKLLPDFLTQFTMLKSNSLLGMKITDYWGKPLFAYGKTTKDQVTLKVCYFNQTLDANIGECYFSWTLYFDKNKIVDDLIAYNKAIKPCASCGYFSLQSGERFGGFSVKESPPIMLPLMIDDNSDRFFYLYYLIFCLSLGLLGAWSWNRLSSLINNYISEPIAKLTHCLKLDSTMDNIDHIEEIQYLVNEISNWRKNINKSLADKHAAKLGKIAAQLAHDIRSPLSAINMVIQRLSGVSDIQLSVVRNSSKRIEDIANDFLVQYRNRSEEVILSPITIQYLPPLLELIFMEKNAQYSGGSVTLTLEISNQGRVAFCAVNEVEFKRVLSNLINNAVEALEGPGSVSITLDVIDAMALIAIRDTGKGIPSHLLAQIAQGGISVGKTDGSGLGLSHARTMMEAWHGSLRLDSVLGEGTSVILYIPLATSPSKPSA